MSRAVRRPTGLHHVVALHACGLDGSSFNALRAELGETCELIGLDHPGHGSHSSKPSPHLEDYVSAALAVIDSHEAPMIHLVGHSFGGVVAALAAAARARRVASLCLLATPAVGGDAFRERASAVSQTSTVERVEGTMSRWFHGGQEAKYPAAAQYARASLQAQSSASAACTWEALAEFAGFVSVGRLPPTLCIAADDDQSTPPTVMRRIVDASGARFHVLREGGHLFPLTEPGIIAGPMIEHWDRHAVAGSALKGGD